MATSRQVSKNFLQGEIDRLQRAIDDGCLIFNSNIEALTIIVAGRKGSVKYSKIIDFKAGQDKPGEFKEFIQLYVERLVNERNAIYTVRDKLIMEAPPDEPAA